MILSSLTLYHSIYIAYIVSSTSKIGEFVLYKEHKDVASMTESAVASFREEFSLSMYPEEDAIKYKPLTKFQHIEATLGTLCPHVQAYISNKNFQKPSPIQVLFNALFTCA